MMNEEIVTNWKSLSVLLDGETTPHKISEHFMLCWGECQDGIEMVDGTKVKVVIFDTGGEMGSPSLWCHSDEEDNCWELYVDAESQKSKEKKIGKFVREDGQQWAEEQQHREHQEKIERRMVEEQYLKDYGGF